MIKRLFFTIIFVLNILNIANAGTVERYFVYQTDSEVNNINLNGNINNIITMANGGWDNTNINTAAGYRLYEVLGTLPTAGTLGRTVFYTVDKTLNFDTGSVWYSAITLLRPPVQGDIVYFDGTNWVVLGYGTKGQALTTNGVTANPAWGGMTTQGDIEYNNGTTRTRLAPGTSGQFLKTQGAGANPIWGDNPALSNVIYCWLGSDVGTTNVFGMVEGTSLIPTMSTYTVNYHFFGVYGSTYRTILTGRFVKIAGISTVTIHARIWTADVLRLAYLSADIGGQSNSVNTLSATPVWVTTSTIDVSSLTNGTAYDITIQLKDENASVSAYCSGLILTGS